MKKPLTITQIKVRIIQIDGLLKNTKPDTYSHKFLIQERAAMVLQLKLFP
jgi:hypothetical protein